jgi:HTH-type transcriptional regulator / antitoxin HigA
MATELKPIRNDADHEAAMEEGLTRRDLEGVIGTRTRIAEVLNRRRGLSIDMIRRLHDRLGIPAEVLIRPSRKAA